MLIRKLTEGDAQVLQACRLFGLEESPEAFLVSPAEVAATPLSAVEAELRDPNIHYLGALQGEELVGFMRYVRPNRISRRHTAEVRSVYVKKAVRGQQVGSRLLDQLIEHGRGEGLESLTLSVLANNDSARRLYRTRGFQLYGTEPRAIRKGEHYVDQEHYWLNLAVT